MKSTSSRWWRYLRGLTPAAILLALVVGIIIYAVENRLRDEMEFEDNILKEWVTETRVGQSTLPELVKQLLTSSPQDKDEKRDAILTHMTVLGELTKINQGLMPLFPFVYRMEMRFVPDRELDILWNSNSPIPRDIKPQVFPIIEVDGVQSSLHIYVQLRAFANRQEEIIQRQTTMRHALSLLAILAAGVALFWVVLFLRHERMLELKDYQSREQLDMLERNRLKEQLLREEEELKRQEAEKQVLEAQTKIYSDINVLAGSYAHNIKNLLVRPNDLLNRFMTEPVTPEDARHLIGEARESLRAVSERTQQILRTVHRDLSKPVFCSVELNELVSVLSHQWQPMARQQWKMEIREELFTQPVVIQGDKSHLTQVLENLLCNARDATFEERTFRRDQARLYDASGSENKKEKLLHATAWQGTVSIRVEQDDKYVRIVVTDNGIGMSEEVLNQCTQARFTTKRNNALHEGLASGLGLGLSFVSWVMEQHRGSMQIVSAEHQGTTITLLFPHAAEKAR
ncbi:MAG: HAMP domain-containing histidine kinase [Planctomycetia bacterium]|nr:HAMP domain-containing histidine kinase [Planctomycetia bacterium]